MSCKRLHIVLTALILLLALLGGCKKEKGTAPESDTPPVVSGMDTESLFTDRDTDSSYVQEDVVTIEPEKNTSDSSTSSSIQQDGTVTITEAGTFRLTGRITGPVVVDAQKTDKVQLVLDGVTITGESVALYVRQADKVFITLAQGSKNVLTATGEAITDGDTNVDGTLFSKEDMTINGTGSLTVTSGAGHGIVCKDSLAITAGTYTVQAAGHAIQGKDDVRVAAGTFTLTAEKDGIHVENAEDATRGYLYIQDGTFTIAAGGDGLSASGALQIDGGTGSITAGGGAANASPQQSGMGGFGGWFGQASATTEDDTSMKGIKSSADLLLKGGIWRLDTADDGLHSNANLAVAGGTVSIAAGDDGLHADETTTVQGGDLTITESYEGIEGNAIEIAGGTIKLTASDDGLNAAGGADESGYGGMGRPDEFSDNGSSYIRITGGSLCVNASGDGIDSNGGLYVAGGETYVSGPTNSGNGALDYGGSAEVSGGIFVAAGASGMAQNFSSADGQGAMLVNGYSGSAGAIILKDAGGKELLNWTPEKSYSSVVITCPGIEKGQTYTLTMNGSTTQITMSDWLYGSSGGMGGGMGGGPGGMGGGMGGGGRPGGRW